MGAHGSTSTQPLEDDASLAPQGAVCIALVRRRACIGEEEKEDGGPVGASWIPTAVLRWSIMLEKLVTSCNLAGKRPFGAWAAWHFCSVVVRSSTNTRARKTKTGWTPRDSVVEGSEASTCPTGLASSCRSLRSRHLRCHCPLQNCFLLLSAERQKEGVRERDIDIYIHIDLYVLMFGIERAGELSSKTFG